MNVLDKTIGQLIQENYVYARALHYLGIQFYEYEDMKLRRLCDEKGLDRDRIIKSFCRFDGQSRIPFREIERYPLSLMLEYLRYAHHCYIKQHLPYIGGLIDSLDLSNPKHVDLHDVFPLFVEDFIKHVYEEEDQLFAYIDRLIQITTYRPKNLLSNIWRFRHFSLQKQLDQHELEDEMAGLRALVNELPSGNLRVSVIREEILAFDREIMYHAAIENQLLFPKAINLEQELTRKLDLLAKAN